MKYILIAFVVILALVSVGHSVKTLVTCDGTTVRGAFKYECIMDK